MRIIAFLSQFILVLIVSTVFASEVDKAGAEPEKTVVIEKKDAEKNEAEAEEFKPRKWFFGTSATLLNFSSVVNSTDEIDYDIDSATWLAVSGSYRFKKGLTAMLNVNLDANDAKNGLDLLGQISKGNWIVQVTSGKFTGDVSVSSAHLVGSYTQSKQDISTKYLALDLLYSSPTSWACDSCIPAIRYVQYEIPSAVGIGAQFSTLDFNVPNASTSGDILDPALAFKGLMGIMSFSTQRDFVLGEKGETLTKASVPQGFAKGMTQTQKLGHSFGAEGHTGIGFGFASVSDEGKANVAAVSGGRTLEDDSRFVMLYEVSIGFLWSYNQILKNGGRWSTGIGYNYRLTSSFSSLNQDDPSSADLLTLEDIFIGFEQHGPTANFYMSF